MLGNEINFQLEWVSIYSFQCRRVERFRHGRVIFAGDSAHEVSPFGARGANSGIQDADNLSSKLKAVLDGVAPMQLLDSYDSERGAAAQENILNSTRSTDFITPKSAVSRIFRDAVLNLAEQYPFAQPLVNSGRLSLPCFYDNSLFITPDTTDGPARSRPGAPCPDVSLPDGYLLQYLSDNFTVLWLNSAPPSTSAKTDLAVTTLVLHAKDDPSGPLKDRYLDPADRAVYLIRPDQHITARWFNFDPTAIQCALDHALARALNKDLNTGLNTGLNHTGTAPEPGPHRRP